MKKDKWKFYTLPLAGFALMTAAVAGHFGIASDGGGSGNQPGTAGGAGAPGASPSPEATASPEAAASPSPEATASPEAAASPEATASPTAEAPERVVYEAALNPANASGATGTVRVVVDGNQAGIYIQAFGVAPGIPHLQHIHSGTQCADFSQDTNQDGFVDAVEGEPVAGRPVLPLTLNLGQQQTSGAGGASPSPAASPTDGTGAAVQDFPVASANGNYTYIGSISITEVRSMLEAESGNGSGTAGAASDAQMLAQLLNSRVIEIHGISPDVQLPDTVQSIMGLPATTTLPVACGVLVEVEE